MITCWDLKGVPGKPGCCGSCHDDADEFGIELPYGDHWAACCTVGAWLSDNGVDVFDKADESNPIVVAVRRNKEAEGGCSVPPLVQRSKTYAMKVQELVTALEAVLAAIAQAQSVGCISHLDCWEDASRDWYTPVKQARALLGEYGK